jgi:hypothetical protein
LAIHNVFDVISAASGDVEHPFVDTIKAEAMLERCRILTEAMAERALGLVVVQGTIEGVALCGIHEGELAMAKFGRRGVCSEVEAGFR